MRVSKQPTNSGALRHKIEIQSRAVTPTADNKHTEVFATLATVQAAIKTLPKGIEVWDGQNLSGVGSHHFTIRQRDGLASDQWILFNARRFRILTIEFVMERNRFQRLLCVERGSEDFDINTQ